LLFYASGCTELERKVIIEEELDEEVESESIVEDTNEVEQVPRVEEPEPIKESTSEVIEEETPKGNLVITPATVNAGDIITIKGTASGDRGFLRELTFYPAEKKLRIGETKACRKSSYCFEAFNQEYKLSENLKPGQYYAKIYDRDLNDYVYGYFIVI